jgi:hypothetical protein
LPPSSRTVAFIAALDTAGDGQVPLAVRAGIAIPDVAQIGDLRQGEVPNPVYAEEMLAVLVGSGAEVRRHRHRAVGDAGDRQIQGSEGARPGADGGTDLFLGGHAQGGSDLGQLLRLDGIELVIAAHQQGDEACL